MQDQLQILITYYEEEKNRLLKIIDEYVKESEYQFAHFHAEAVFQLNRHLRSLKRMQDALYDEKSFQQMFIDNIVLELKKEIPDYMREYLVKDLEKHRKILNNLNQTPSQTQSLNSANLFDETLNKLLNKKIISFKLILNKSTDLLFDFKLSKKSLKVTFPNLKRHLIKDTLDENIVGALEKLGFQITGDKGRLVLVLIGNKEEIVSKVKFVLSKIVFDILHFRQSGYDSYIEIRSKASR